MAIVFSEHRHLVIERFLFATIRCGFWLVLRGRLTLPMPCRHPLKSREQLCLFQSVLRRCVDHRFRLQKMTKIPMGEYPLRQEFAPRAMFQEFGFEGFLFCTHRSNACHRLRHQQDERPHRFPAVQRHQWFRHVDSTRRCLSALLRHAPHEAQCVHLC